MDAIDDRLFDFIGNVAHAPTMQELENRYLDGIGTFVRASAAGLYVLDPFTHGAQGIAARGVSDFFLSRYEELGRHHDPVLERVLVERRAVDNALLMPAEQWSDLPVYGEVFRLHRMMNLMEAPIVVDGEVIGTLNFGRTAAEGPFAQHDRRVADAIARLLGAALASVRTRTELTRQRDQALAALELCSDAVVVTDLHRAQRRLNLAARQLFDQLSDGEAALEELMMRKPGSDGAMARHDLPVSLADGDPARLTARVRHAESDPNVVICMVDLLTSEIAARVLPGELTQRERDVAELAARGLRDAEIATQLSLSRYTVKQHLKAVYGKLGIRSRVELARLLA
ncbi:LuxR C-terminal-related transcriptional regulator [Capillimicrobium parvum]|nr:LuxR C-terminal-related transcriptional regulator [Capillimicrobium parvum]